MKLFSFFRRKQPADPPAPPVHTDFPVGELPSFLPRGNDDADVIELRGLLPPATPDDYRPKAVSCRRADRTCQYNVDCERRGICVDVETTFLLSLPRDKRLKLARIVRHGYGPVIVRQAAPLRMAA